MKKIAVVTTTRAEYGLLSPVIKKLREMESSSMKIILIATGTHLSSDYGMTVNEIKERIDFREYIPVNSNTELDISKNQAEALVTFTELFAAERFDGVILLGDRYEILAIAIAAGNTRTPIFHISGGDTTEGATDEWIRHSVTKISYLHFVTNEESRRRVIQLGENPARVFNYGSTSIDNIINIADMTKKEALESITMPSCKYALCTYHPVTMENSNIDMQIENFLNAVRYFSGIQFIATKSNADRGGARINEILDGAGINNLHVFASLGARKYLSLMRHAEFVIGNSSSGIIEAPALHVPTVNIGDRQKGRLQSESIINCGEGTEEIILAVEKALSAEHKEICEKTKSPYGDGHAAGKIATKAVETVINETINLKKKFYDAEIKS